MCDERNSLSDLHRAIQENMHTINMKIKSNGDFRQTATSTDHNDLLQCHIDLSLISTDKDEKMKKLENMRNDIEHSIELFQKILKLQNDRNQNSLLDAEIVSSVLKHNRMFENLTQKDLCSIVERLQVAKTRLFDIAKRDGLKLQPYGESKAEENRSGLKKMKEKLVLIEEVLEEKKRNMEELIIIISEKTKERDNLKREIVRLETVDLEESSRYVQRLTTKKRSLCSQIVVHYDLTNCIEYKTEVERDDSSQMFDVSSISEWNK